MDRKGWRLRRFMWLAPLAGMICLAAGALMVYTGAGPSPQCRSPQQGSLRPSRLEARALLSGGERRCYLLYVPASVEGMEAVPLVVVLHGFADNGAGIARISRWHDLAESEGFVVAYPDGTSFPLRWNTAPQANVEVDDVQFFRDLVSDAGQHISIDLERVYISGFSNGASMASRVACEAGDLIAAYGVVSGHWEYAGERCGSAPARAVIGFFSSDDPIARLGPALTGTGELPDWFKRLMNVSTEAPDLPDYSTREWVEDIAERAHCAAPPQDLPTQGDVSGLRHTGCDDGAEVVLYTIAGGGHQWPGGEAAPGMGRTTRSIDATYTMWQFFETHPRAAAP